MIPLLNVLGQEPSNALEFLYHIADHKAESATSLITSDAARQALASFMNLEEFTVLDNVARATPASDDAIEVQSSLIEFLCTWLRRWNVNNSYMGGRLPNEILSQIFSHVWEEWDSREESGAVLGAYSSSLSVVSESPYAWNSPYYRLKYGLIPPWFSLRLVCTQWRDIIDDTSSLWTSLSFLIKSERSFNRFQQGMEITRRAVGRKHPLDFSLCLQRFQPFDFLPVLHRTDSISPFIRDAAESILPPLYRYAILHARSFHVEAPDIYIQPILHMSNTFWPELENLTLVFQSSFCNSCPNDHDGLAFFDAPKLKRLTIMAEYINNSLLTASLCIAWDQLTHLTIRESRLADPSHIRELFWSCSKSLQVCEIRMLGWEGGHHGLVTHEEYLSNPDKYASAEIFRFPYLTDLFLDFNRYLPHSEMLWGENENEAGFSFNTFIGPMFDYLSLPALRSLRIWTSVPRVGHTLEASWDFNSFPSEYFGLVELQARSGFALERFQLAYPGFGGPKLREFLRTVPGLRTLDLRGTDYAWMHVLEEMWMTEDTSPPAAPAAAAGPELEPRPGQEPVPPKFLFLPNLKHLLIHESEHPRITPALYEWRVQVFSNIIRKRCSIPAPYRTLEKVIFDIVRMDPNTPVLPPSISQQLLNSVPAEVGIIVSPGVRSLGLFGCECDMCVRAGVGVDAMKVDGDEFDWWKKDIESLYAEGEHVQRLWEMRERDLEELLSERDSDIDDDPDFENEELHGMVWDD